MRILLFAVAVLCVSLSSTQALHAKSKNEIREGSRSLVEGHRREAGLIYNWLKNTPEISIHQMRGATGNVVYTLPPGHNREAVYDASGKLVQDGMNSGSYNYFPYDQPLNHFMYDILPWWLWGNSKGDPTTQEERLTAYVDDLGRGLSRMRKAQHTTVDLDKLAPHETVVLAMFIKAIEDGGAGKIYGYLADSKLEVTASDGKILGDELEKGLAEQLKNYRDITALTPRLPKR